MKSLHFTIRNIVFLIVIVILAGTTINLVHNQTRQLNALSQITSPPVTAIAARPQEPASTETAATKTPTPRVYFATPVPGATYTPTPIIIPTSTPQPAFQAISDGPLLPVDLQAQMQIRENDSVWVEAWPSVDKIILRVGYHPNSIFWTISMDDNQAEQISWQTNKSSVTFIEELRQFDERVDYVQISPDGQWGAWGQGETLLVKQLGADASPIDLLGNIKYESFRRGSGRLVWSPQSDKLAYVVENGNLYHYEIRITDFVKQKTTISLKDTPPADIAWAPDGQYLAFKMLKEPQSGIENLYIVKVDGSGLTELLQHGHVNGPIHWSSTGDAIAYTNRLYRKPWLVRVAQ